MEQGAKPKAIIFDFFDVFQKDAYKSWLAANDFPNPQEYADASRQLDKGMLSSSEFLQRLSALSGQDVTWNSLGVGGAINGDVVAIAEALKERYGTALLSNAPSDLLRGILTDNDLERLFDRIVISSEVGYAKPDPEIFSIALGGLSARPQEAVFIDDNPAHVNAAKAMGMNGIQFTSAPLLRKALVGMGLL